jgi:hypothetical protein
LFAPRAAAARADAPPPPNPAAAAGGKWPARRAQSEKEWLKLLGPFPAAKPPLDVQVLSTESVPASPDDPSYPIRTGGSTRSKVKFRSEADAGGGTQSDLWIYGWLLVPKSVTEACEKHGAKSPWSSACTAPLTVRAKAAPRA